MLYKIFDIIPYKCKLYITNGDPEEVTKFLKWKHIPYADELKLKEQISVATTYTKGGHIIINSYKPVEDSVMVHEMLHAINYALYRAGLELSSSSEEAFCYHLEYMFKQYKDTPFKSKKFD